MAADYHTFHIAGSGAGSLADIVAETAAVQLAAHTDNAVFGQTGGLVCEVGHSVHGVCNHQEDCVGRVLCSSLYNRIHDACVDTDEFFAGHSGLAGDTGGDYDNISVGSGRVVVGDAFDTGVETVQFSCLHHIDGLALGQTLFDVDENQIRNTSAVCDCVGNCCTYVAGADNCYFCHFN